MVNEPVARVVPGEAANPFEKSSRVRILFISKRQPNQHQNCQEFPDGDCIFAPPDGLDKDVTKNRSMVDQQKPMYVLLISKRSMDDGPGHLSALLGDGGYTHSHIQQKEHRRVLRKCRACLMHALERWSCVALADSTSQTRSGQPMKIKSCHISPSVLAFAYKHWNQVHH